MAVFVLVAAVVLTLLTQTQFGRDVLRNQIENAFNRSFRGELSIGRLNGNLLQDLYASDVRLLDPEGGLVLQADSVALKPHWRSLFRNAFIADEIELFSPVAHFSRSETGRWNIERALASSRAASDATPDPIDIHSGRLRIVDGRVTTTSFGADDRSARFDFANTTVHELNASLEFNMSDAGTFVSINDFRATFPAQNVTVESLSGEFGVAGDLLRFDDIVLRTADSRVGATFAMEPLSAPLASRTIELHVDEGSLAMVDVRAFLPSIPLSDVISIEGQFSGPVNGLSAENIEVASGTSRLVANGRLTGLPDSLGFSLTTTGSVIQTDELSALLSAAGLPEEVSRLGRVSLDGDVTGSVRSLSGGTSVRLEGDISASTDAGQIEGYVAFVHSPNRRPTYTIDATASAIDPGILLAESRYSGSINGVLFVTNNVDREGEAGMEFQVALSATTFAGREADSLNASGSVSDGVATANFALAQGAGRISGEATYTVETETFDFQGDLSSFDLSRLLPDAPRSRITAPLAIQTTGTDRESFSGRLDATISEATFVVDNQTYTLPAGLFSLSILEPGGIEPVIGVKTPMIEAYVNSPHRFATLLQLTEQWTAAFEQTVRNEAKKPRAGAGARPLLAESIRATPSIPAQAFDFELSVRDTDLLQAVYPDFPDLAGTALRISGIAGSDTLSTVAHVSGPRFSAGKAAISSGSFNLDATINTPFAAQLADVLSAQIQLRTRNLRVGGQLLQHGSFALDLDNRTLHSTILGSGLLGSKTNRVELEGNVEIRPNTNHLSFDTFNLDLGGYTWTVSEQVS
ncbi:MAG: hypothetical protein R3284_04765, partial [Rubricoccaceae bacterium]|nr:hypothetical protein [Rubricoccaceae bacterium]